MSSRTPRSCFELDPSARVRRLTIGGFPAVVVDGLYADPEAVRELALGLEDRPLEGAYPGVAGRIEAPTEPLLERIGEWLGQTYGFTPETLRPRPPGGFEFRRITLGIEELKPIQRLPHVDDALLAGVVYLEPEERCRGGLAFYRHRPTGLDALYLETSTEEAPLDPDQQAVLARLGLYNGWLALRLRGNPTPYARLKNLIYGRPEEDSRIDDGGSVGGGEATWQRIERIEMRFNRLILFPGFLFHGPILEPGWFGPERHRQRLSQNLFFPGARVGSGARS